MKRNMILISLAIAVAATALAAETKTSATVRDRLWIFAVAAGLNDSYLELGGVRGGSRMTPTEGAFWLGVPNMLFIRVRDIPPLPGTLESWRAKTAFEQYAISFQPLDRVVWSVVGGGGEGGMKELPFVLPLAMHPHTPASRHP